MVSKIKNIEITTVKQLPESERVKIAPHSGFVEIRVEEESEPAPKVIKLKKSPGTILREEFINADIKEL